MVPGAGACSRTMPLPVISTSRPAAAACSMTLRTGRPSSEGTRRVVAPATRTVAVAGGDAPAGCGDEAVPAAFTGGALVGDGLAVAD